MEAYVHGVSTRKVDDLVTALGVDTGISKSEVSRICARLDEQVAAHRAPPAPRRCRCRDERLPAWRTLCRGVGPRCLRPGPCAASGAAPAGVSAVVRGAAGRAGLGEMAAHRLRHTTVTTMLRSGSTLSEVGQVLRHRTAFSTVIYAKIDRDALRTLAVAWPATAADLPGGVS